MGARLAILSPTPGRGGAEEYLLAVAETAARHGWDVVVSFELSPLTRTLAADVTRIDGVRYLRASIRGGRRWGVAGQALATVGALLRARATVSMVITPWPRLVLGNVIAAALLGVPTAVVFQLAPFAVDTGRCGRWARRAQRRRQRWIAPSDQSADVIRATFALTPDAVQTIYNGGPDPVESSDEDRAAARDALRRDLGLDAEARVVVTVGRLDAQKGHGDLLEAVGAATGAARYADVRFAWVGEGDLRAELEAAIADHGLERRIRLLGHRREVGGILEGADLFVLPSRFEGLPFALLEALAHGVPVIASDAGGMPEVVRDRVDGLIHRRQDPDDLAAKLVWALDHPDRMQAMASSGRARSASFTSARMLQETLAVLEELRPPER
jgi:glycosyltransferase involved in cell wall biosynthesis